MRPTFSIAGIPVRVEPFFFVIAALLGFSVSSRPAALGVWVTAVFVSILWHELGHAFAFRAFGYDPHIRLQGMGGETSAPIEGLLPPGRDVLISLAGPAAGLALGFAVLGIGRSAGPLPPLAELGLAHMVWINIGWGLLNLLPILPLDGGRVMSSGFRKVLGARGEAAAMAVSVAGGSAAAFVAYRAGLTWAAMLAAFFTLGNVMGLLAGRDQARAGKLPEVPADAGEAPKAPASGGSPAVPARAPASSTAAEAAAPERFVTGPDGNPSPAPATPVPGEAVGVDAPPGFCHRHPAVATERNCARCGRPICRRCTLISGAGRICPGCAAELKAASSGSPSSLTPVVTAILAANAAVFLLQMLSPQITPQFGQSPVAIAAGQWWRLITPVFLHAGVLHIFLNSYAIWIYGPQLERAIGRWTFAGVYLATGLAGNALSYAFGSVNNLSVGASGAVFGLIGVTGALVFRNRRMPAGRGMLQGLVLIVAANLFIGFTARGIDNLAHIGGLVGGLIAGAGIARAASLRARAPAGVRPAGNQSAAAILATAAVVALSAGLAVWRTAALA